MLFNSGFWRNGELAFVDTGFGMTGNQGARFNVSLTLITKLLADFQVLKFHARDYFLLQVARFATGLIG